MGSQATYGGWEAKTCSRCGDKVVLTTGPGYMFHWDHKTRTATTICALCLKK